MGYGVKERQLDMKQAVNLGKVVGAGMLTTGRICFVKAVDDTDRRDFLVNIPKRDRFDTIQAALNVCKDDANDYVLVAPNDANAAWAQTDDLDVKGTGEAGRALHLIGLERGPNQPEISFSTAKALRIGNGAVTGDRCRNVELANFRISASGTTNVHCLELGDSNGFTYDTIIRNCHIASTATTAAKAEIKDFSTQAYFENCRIGQPTTHCDDNYLQGAGAAAAGITIFKDCEFIHFAAATTDQYATTVASGNTLFLRCTFYNANHAAQAIATGIVSAGMAILANCHMVATTMATTAKSLAAPSGMGVNVALADVFNPGIMVDGVAPIASDT
jgi:hypothetical protein